MSMWRDFLLKKRTDGFVFDNACTNFCIDQLNGRLIPISINHHEYKNNEACSHYSAIVDCSWQELRKHSLPDRAAIILTACVLAPILRWIKIDRTIVLNNWLLCTTLHPKTMSIGRGDLDRWVKKFPQHSITVKSLTKELNAELFDQVAKLGFLVFSTRRVAIFDQEKIDFCRKRNFKSDNKLLIGDTYKVANHSEIQASDMDQVRKLYQKLYLEKHSTRSPDFSPELFEVWRQGGEIEFTLVKSRDETQVHAFVAFWVVDDVLSVPLLGYDEKMGMELYRIISALTLSAARERKLKVNFSSGAEQFKLKRGAALHQEFLAIYIEHLPMWKKVIYRILHGLANWSEFRLYA